jgi:hypothetical protein
MDLQLEPVFEKRLKHGPSHHVPAFRAVRFRLDLVTLRIDPGRASFKPPIQRSAVGLSGIRDDVCELDEKPHRQARQIQPVGGRCSISGSSASRSGATWSGIPALAGLDGGDFEFGSRVRLGEQAGRFDCADD